MKPTQSKDEAQIYQSTARAEDGLQPNSRRDKFYEQVIIPIGSIFAVLLIILGVQLISH